MCYNKYIEPSGPINLEENKKKNKKSDDIIWRGIKSTLRKSVILVLFSKMKMNIRKQKNGKRGLT